MSGETQRLTVIAKAIKRSTSLKNEEKIQELSKAVDEFAQFILRCYLEEKCEVKQ